MLGYKLTCKDNPNLVILKSVYFPRKEAEEIVNNYRLWDVELKIKIVDTFKIPNQNVLIHNRMYWRTVWESSNKADGFPVVTINHKQYLVKWSEYRNAWIEWQEAEQSFSQI